MFDINKCQKIKIPQGALYLGPSDEKQSVGYLELDPKQSLTLHNRPAIEKLIQVNGMCDMIIYNEEETKVITLTTGKSCDIKADIYHIHCNPHDDVSLTYWDFDGDIRNIIMAIKEKASH